ncbi:MAG: RsmG family class I SAM-dependent methyltransferase, partial [Candidatus Eisenbacteria bacterium]
SAARRPENRGRRVWTPPPSATRDRRWPNVDRVLARQPWADVKVVLERNEIPDVARTVERLRRLVELLVQWNRSVSNLISKNDEERIVAGHVLPSIELAGWLKSANLIHWCDLGSGGGFPALPLVICGVGSSWDLVESRRTKTLFLLRAIGDLELTGVRVLASRIEDLIALVAPARATAAADEGSLIPHGEVASEDSAGWGVDQVDPEWTDRPIVPLTPPYDGFTSRATLTLAPTLEHAARIVRPDGTAFLWKGSRLAAEAKESSAWRTNWEEGEARPLSVEHSVVVNFKRRKV